MKILTNNATFTYADIAKPTDYEKWESKEEFLEKLVDIGCSFVEVILATSLLVGIVFLATLM